MKRKRKFLLSFMLCVMGIFAFGTTAYAKAQLVELKVNKTYRTDVNGDGKKDRLKIVEKNMGVLLIRELPDSVKEKETEAEAYSAVWDLMIELEKNLPMAYVFYGQDSLVENNNRYDEIGIFLPNSIFLKNLERHVAKAEEIIYGEK